MQKLSTFEVRTLDGVSTVSLQSDLGKCVGKARSGAVFGEPLGPIRSEGGRVGPDVQKDARDPTQPRLALMHKDATRKAGCARAGRSKLEKEGSSHARRAAQGSCHLPDELHLDGTMITYYGHC